MLMVSGADHKLQKILMCTCCTVQQKQLERLYVRRGATVWLVAAMYVLPAAT